MSSLFVYRCCAKVNTNLATRDNWYLMVSVESAQLTFCQELDKHFEQPQLWGHDDDLINRNSVVGLPLGCHLSTLKKKKKIRRFCIPESGADDSRQASSPKKLSFRLRLTAFSPLPSGTSNAGRQRKAHPPENLARHQECIFMYFMFASFYLRSISNTFS